MRAINLQFSYCRWPTSIKITNGILVLRPIQQTTRGSSCCCSALLLISLLVISFLIFVSPSFSCFPTHLTTFWAVARTGAFLVQFPSNDSQCQYIRTFDGIFDQ